MVRHVIPPNNVAQMFCKSDSLTEQRGEVSSGMKIPRAADGLETGSFLPTFVSYYVHHVFQEPL